MGLDVESVVSGQRRRAAPQAALPMEGVVRSVAAAGVSFVVPDYDGGRHLFGPAPWHRGSAAATDADGGGTDPAHVHTAAPPPVGARCLVVFAGGSIERPWVVAWWTP